MPLTTEEAHKFFRRAVNALQLIEASERAPHRAVPVAALTCGEADEMLAAFVVLLVETHPIVLDTEETAALAAIHFRESH